LEIVIKSNITHYVETLLWKGAWIDYANFRIHIIYKYGHGPHTKRWRAANWTPLGRSKCYIPRGFTIGGEFIELLSLYVSGSSICLFFVRFWMLSATNVIIHDMMGRL
jgi:hypothetical protein